MPPKIKSCDAAGQSWQFLRIGRLKDSSGSKVGSPVAKALLMDAGRFAGFPSNLARLAHQRAS